ncbi:MAG TPA: endonuclease III [Myxococcota bacterium]|nr:endonuclease III [Myxococcota bacterium]HQK51387.1 endonuclease III [Myxococcota bacterium]
MKAGTRASDVSAGDWDRLVADLRQWLEGLDPPSVTRIAGETEDPFRVLVATLLSLRTRDPVTDLAASRLFEVAPTPEALAALPLEVLMDRIRPVNFYRTKAIRLKGLAERLVREFGGRVPADLDVLLSFPGVGRKTANLVLAEGFAGPGLCVDTHVHRITNRLGWIRTRTPDQTEQALRERLPAGLWRPINPLLVRFGQEVCRPQSPWCSRCPLADRCRRVGVTRSR